MQHTLEAMSNNSLERSCGNRSIGYGENKFCILVKILELQGYRIEESCKTYALCRKKRIASPSPQGFDFREYNQALEIRGGSLEK